MTWEELKEKVKDLYYNSKIGAETIILDKTFWFDKTGGFGISNDDGSYEIVKDRRTPDQMYAIMKALE